MEMRNENCSKGGSVGRVRRVIRVIRVGRVRRVRRVAGKWIISTDNKN